MLRLFPYHVEDPPHDVPDRQLCIGKGAAVPSRMTKTFVMHLSTKCRHQGRCEMRTKRFRGLELRAPVPHVRNQ
jgi:hypothetical protein